MHAHRIVAVAAGCALACARGQHVPSTPLSSGPKEHVVEVPGHGGLAFDLPAGWDVRPGEPEEERRTVELGPEDRRFVALLTVFPNRPEAPDAEPLDTARLFAELARRSAAPGALEGEVPLVELAGPVARGYWFEATDRALEGKAPGADEYRHLVQGAAVVGDLLVAFTLLDNAPGPQRQALLDLVRGARPLGAAAGAGDAAGPGDAAGGAAGALVPDPRAQTVPYVARDAAGTVSVLVDLAGFRMFEPRSNADGSATAVVGEDPQGGVVVSIILRPAPGVDAAGCRDRDLADLRKAVPGLTGIATEEVRGQARLRYEVPAGQGAPARQLHAHAFLARDGVCVNLHLSKANPGPDDGARLARILDSLRFGEKL
jgi:hypothetical protein